ncbi:MAG: hypothetical protein KIC46_04960 [Clostridiales bacterium]|nr:hypothetical protein [Clostridiales bacterium]
MPFTAEELEAMRLADEEIDREYEVSSTDTEISNWLDELAINDTLDHKQLHKKRQKRAYYEEHKDEIRTYQQTYMREYRKRKRQQKYMIAAEIKNAASDTATVRKRHVRKPERNKAVLTVLV